MIETLNAVAAYRQVAAMQTLDKWYLLRGIADERRAVACKAFGLVWRDRHLCGDAEKGRKIP